MAGLRIGASSPPVVTRPVPAVRAEAAKAAQRAFFETALRGDIQTASTTVPLQPVTAATASRTLSFNTQAEPPTAILRPGSLLNIKV